MAAPHEPQEPHESPDLPPHAVTSPAPAPTPPAAPGPPALARATPFATTLRLFLPLAAMVSLLLLVGGALWGGARWLLATEDGTRWLFDVLPSVQAQGVRGALLGPRLQVESLRVQWHGGKASVRIDGLDVQGMAWRWSEQPSLWLELDIARATARRVVVDSGPRGPRPLPSPASLAAPLRATVAEAALDELNVDEAATLTALSARAAVFDGRKGQAHSVDHAAAQGWGLTMVASGRIGNQAPLAVQVAGTVAPANAPSHDPAWAAAVSASGPLARIALSATLRGVPRTGVPRAAAAAPRLDAQAEWHPLEAWQLARLVASTEALDLAALVADAPQTRLSGQVQVDAPASGAPITAAVRLDNQMPGRWNDHRLPVARAAFVLQGQTQRPDRLEATKVELELADGSGRAGRLDGKVLWEGAELWLEARLSDVTPQRLDSRAAAMTLTGPTTLKLTGVSAPGHDARDAAAPWRAELQLALDGRLDAAPASVALKAQAQLAAGRVELKRLQASAGAASAELQATLQRASQGWQWASRGHVEHFDPTLWWPGEAGGAWRQGPHRLDADWQLDLLVPRNVRAVAPAALLQSLSGSGRLRVHESLLAGVPVSADLTMGTRAADARAGVAASSTLHGELSVGGNHATLDGRADPFGSGEGDRWRATVQAENLATLAPLARLHPVLSDWVPRQGRASATLAAEGRWPSMATEGQAHVEALRAGALAVTQGELRWRLQVGREGSGDDTPLTLVADVSGLQLGPQRAERLRGELRGTLAAHRIELLGVLPVAPPPLVERLLGRATQRGTRALLAAQGGWRAEDGHGRWRARIDRLVVGPWDGESAADAPLAGALWAETRDLQAELTFDRQGTLETLHAEPGRLSLAAGAVALRWDAVNVDLRRERADFELRADIEPFALAPLLGRVQPAMGWAGDLRLAAKVAVKAAERVEADLVFERRDGDLHLASSDGVQRLGLDEFKLALAARDGVWTFNPVFSGRSLGEIRGSLTARTAPDSRWPAVDAPVQGQVQARVADLGIWATFVPPGWRLTGELRTTAAVGGRFGAPTYTGELTGSGLGVRNLLQGVNVSDGQLHVVLAGESARVERCSVKGGDGLVQVSGGATFGDSPQAKLQLQAEHFRVFGRVDRQLSVSGNAELVLSAATNRLDGKLRVDEGLFDFTRGDAPSLDDDVTLRQARADEALPADAGAQRPRRDFTLALDIDLGEGLRVRGRGVDTGLRGSVRITNPGARLAVNGTINAEGGTYAAYGQKLDIEHGALVFGGPLDNPRLDILAIRPNLDTRVGLLISGTAQAPRVRLFAEPELSETEKLAWLLLGRASEGLGRNDTTILQRAAVALLAGEGAAPTDALLRALGIDEISVRQSDTDVRETVISLGKQLSRRWYVGYERGVNATTGTWQLIYRIAQRLTVRAQSGLESSLDAIWTWRVQEAPLEPGPRRTVPARAAAGAPAGR